MAKKTNGATEPAPTEQPEIGRENCTDETRRDYYRQALVAKIAHEAAVATAKTKNGEYRNVLKAADKAGVDSKAIAATLAVRFDDEDELVIRLRESLKMLDLSGTVPGILDKILARYAVEEPTRNEREAMDLGRAYDGGVFDGRSGTPRDANPHPPGSELHATHDRGWLMGQSTIASEMVPAQ